MNRKIRRRLAHARYPVTEIQLSSDWCRVDSVYSVRFAVRGRLLHHSWLPCEPTRENHPPLLDFLKVRHAFLLSVQAKLGRPFLADLGFA